MEKEIVDTFCKLLNEFIDDLYRSYPDNSLYLLKKATEAMIYANPSGVVKNFTSCISPYKSKILESDESFFLEGDLEKDILRGEYSFLLDELKKISSIWKDPNTSYKTKKSIWKYFHVLIKLSDKLKG